MRGRVLSLLIGSLGLAAPLHAQEEENPINWQSAVAELSAERTRAESCVSLFKLYASDDTDTMARARIQYDSAKAEMDGVIGALVVALAQGEGPDSFDPLEEQIRRAVDLRSEFCDDALALTPQEEGTKGILVDLLGKAIGSIVTAVKDIWIYRQDAEALERATIQTQVEATRWRPFEQIQP